MSTSMHFRSAQTIPCLRKVATAFLLLFASIWPYSVNAEQGHAAAAQPPPPPATPTFVIRGFDITGDNPLADGAASRVLAPYLRSDATIETLQKATSALEAELKDNGYTLYRVVLPPQEVGAAVTLNIVKFVIGKVTIEGRERLSESNIRASLPELKEGTVPNFRTLAVQTAISNESQGKQLQVSLKESSEPDKIDARIAVKEAKPWLFSVGESNTGSSATGNDRLTVAGSHSNLFDLDHQLTAAYTTSLERPADVRQLGLNYRIPLYLFGGVAGVSYTHSDVVGILAHSAVPVLVRHLVSITTTTFLLMAVIEAMSLLVWMTSGSMSPKSMVCHWRANRCDAVVHCRWATRPSWSRIQRCGATTLIYLRIWRAVPGTT